MFALFLSCSKQKIPLANHSRCGRGNNVSAACNTNNKSNIFCLLNVFINRHNRIWLGVISSFPDYICNVIRWIASKRDMSPSFRIRICILVGWFITIVFHSSSFSNLFRFATWQYTTLFNITYVYFIDSIRLNSIKVSVDSNELWYLPNTKHALYGCVGSYKYQYVAVLSKFFFSIQHSVLLVLNFIQKLFACSFDKCTTICFCLYYRFVASLAFVCLCPLPPPSLSLTVCLSLPLLQFIQIACFRVCVHFHSNYPKIKHSKKYSPYMDERIYISCCYIIVTESYSYLTYLECLHYCWYFYYSVIIQLNYLFSSYLKLYDLGIEDNLCDNILLCLFIRSTHKQILFTFVSFSWIVICRFFWQSIRRTMSWFYLHDLFLYFLYRAVFLINNWNFPSMHSK